MVALAYDTLCDAFCKHCGRQFYLTFNKSDMYDWLSGSLPIQSALPYLSANERELLLSGTCGECFDKMFPPDLDNDE
jgi:L-lysine 2,3-aminomutase